MLTINTTNAFYLHAVYDSISRFRVLITNDLFQLPW